MSSTRASTNAFMGSMRASRVAAAAPRRSFASRFAAAPRRSFASRVFEGEVVAQSPLRREPLDSSAKLKWTLLAAAGVIGIGTLAASGGSSAAPAKVRDEDADELAVPLSATSYKEKRDAGVYPMRVRERLSATYGYFAAGIGLTAATAVLTFRSPAAMRLAATRPMLFLFGSAGVSVAGLIGMHFVPPSSPMKQALWATFVGAQGVSLAPIGFLGGPLIMQALAGTGVMIGSISLIAAMSPSDSFLWMRGPLTIGLGVIVASSLGQIFFPASSLLMNVSLYGGLALFGGMQLYDVQAVAKRARVQTDEQFDAISNSVSMYLNTLNIFIRLVSIMSGSGNNRRR